MKITRFSFMLCLFALSLSACAADAGDPAGSVEAYLTALADGDPDTMAQLSCAEWEVNARASADAYIAVETTLNDLSCTTTSTEDDTAEVTCEGTISVSYEGEQRELPVSGQTFSMVKQGGTWLVCGYAQ